MDNSIFMFLLNVDNLNSHVGQWYSHFTFRFIRRMVDCRYFCRLCTLCGLTNTFIAHGSFSSFSVLQLNQHLFTSYCLQLNVENASRIKWRV